MPKHAQRWSIWKIAAATAGCAAAAALLFVLSHLASNLGGEAAEGPLRRNPALTLPGFLLMLGSAAGVFALLGGVWLGVRIREWRLPAWKRRKR